MRVALVNRFFWRAGAVPSVVREWAEHLEGAGHEVVVFASDVDVAQSAGRRTYVPVRLGTRRVLDEAGWAFAWRLRRAIADFTPHSPLPTPHSALDVLLCTDSTAYFGAWAACRRRRIPAIMAFQGWVYSPGKKRLYPRTVTWAYKLAVHFCARNAPLIACISPEIEEGLRALGVSGERLWRAPNCVDLEAWETGKAGAHRREGRRLLFVGRFSPEKGVPYLIHALASVLKRFPTTVLELVGGEEAEDGEVHRRCRELGMEGRVVFRGVVPREAMKELYAEADLLVMPSLAEGHPLAPLESLACGTPVVASALPGIRATVEDGVTGLLVPPGDAAALAEAIVRVLGDEALLDRMSRAARPSVERFSWEARVRELEQLTTRLAGRRAWSGRRPPCRSSEEGGQGTCPTVVVVFRYDDYHASLGAETRAKEEIERRFLDAFAFQGVPLTLGVVPNYESRALLADDAAALERLRRLLADAPFEAALHGLTHQSFAPQGLRSSEFAGRPQAEQAERLRRGKTLLQEWLGTAVTSFIPPWNTYDGATVAALAETGFTTLSAALSEPAVPAGGASVPRVCALPHTCGLREVRRTVAALARRRCTAFVVCTFHHFSFTESPDPLARHYAQCGLSELERLLAWCRGQPGVELATLGRAAASWRRELADGRVDEARERWALAFAWRRRRLVGRLAIRLWAPRALLEPGAYARGNAWLRMLVGEAGSGGGA